jgi:hypothetical protein
MAKSAEEMDEIVRRCMGLGWGVERIWKHTRVEKGRIAAIRDGHPLNHRMGRREKHSPEVISFIETLYLLDAKLDDGGIARMVNDRVHFDEGPVLRQMVCEVRNKLKIIYRPPFQVQDLKPEHEAIRYTFVKQIQEWRRAGIIKNLMFSDESRFCRGSDNFWVRVRRGAWSGTATAVHQKCPLGVMVLGAIGWDSRVRSPAVRRGLARRSTWGWCFLAV